jgi:hypothetical protein
LLRPDFFHMPTLEGFFDQRQAPESGLLPVAVFFLFTGG